MICILPNHHPSTKQSIYKSQIISSTIPIWISVSASIMRIYASKKKYSSICGYPYADIHNCIRNIFKSISESVSVFRIDFTYPNPHFLRMRISADYLHPFAPRNMWHIMNYRVIVNANIQQYFRHIIVVYVITWSNANYTTIYKNQLIAGHVRTWENI